MQDHRSQSDTASPGIPWRRLLAALPLALLPALLACLFWDIRPQDDALAYWDLAQEWAATGDYGTPEAPGGYWPPGYPFFLMLLVKVLGEAKGAMVAVQFVLFGGSLLLTGVLAWRAFSIRVAQVSMVILGWIYDLATMPAMLLSENLFIPLFLGGALLLLRRDRRLLCAAGSGLLWGLATLVRGNAMLLLPFLMVGVVLWPRWRWESRRAALLPLVVALALFVVPVGLWTARNHRVFGVAVPVSLNSAEVLALSHNPNNTFWTLVPDDPRRVELGLNDPDPLVAYRNAQEVFRKELLEHPVRSAFRSLPKAWFTFTAQIPWFANIELLNNNPENYLSIEGAIYWQWSALLLLSVTGAWITRHSERGARMLILGLCAYWFLFHATMMIVPRYRVPMTPLLAVYAAVAWETLLRRAGMWRDLAMREVARE